MPLDLKKWVEAVPDFPEKGVLFRDITPLLAHGPALKDAVGAMAEPWKKQNISAVCAAEARGFILGSAVALELGAGFIPLRKPGKLPRQSASIKFALEYGEAELELHKEPFPKEGRILLLDDVLATGGTAEAMLKLLRDQGGDVAGFSFLVEIQFLKGRSKLGRLPVESLLIYE